MQTLQWKLFWAGETYWPEQSAGLTFIAPAIEQIGRAIIGDEWKTGQMEREAFPLPPLPMANPSPEWRLWVHATLLSEGVRDYIPSTETIRLPAPAGTFASLGSVEVETEVFRFTERHWDTAYSIVHSRNVALGPLLEANRKAARWVANQILEGNLEYTLLCVSDAGPAADCSPERWRTIDINRIVKRIRRCHMSPTRAGENTGGGYLIYFRSASLARALEIEATAKRRLADEYDAAQDRGEVAKVGQPSIVPEGNDKPATAADIGLTRKDIHEARTIRDAELAEPGVVDNTLTGSLDTDELPAIGSAEIVMLSGAVRRLQARKHYADRVVGWKASRKGPTEAEELLWFKTNFGLGREDVRKIRRDLAPQEWKKTGGKVDR